MARAGFWTAYYVLVVDLVNFGRRLGLSVTLAQMYPPGKSGWNHREFAKAAGSRRWPIKQQHITTS